MFLRLIGTEWEKKNNKYFLGLEKQKNYNSSIFALYKQGEVTTNQAEITQQLITFWGDLYTQKIKNLDIHTCGTIHRRAPQVIGGC